MEGRPSGFARLGVSAPDVSGFWVFWHRNLRCEGRAMESKEDDDPSKIADQTKVVALYVPCWHMAGPKRVPRLPKTKPKAKPESRSLMQVCEERINFR